MGYFPGKTGEQTRAVGGCISPGSHNSKPLSSPDEVVMSKEAGGEQKERTGGIEMEGGTHQDVSLQEQSWLNGDADAGLAVSRDVAGRERWAEEVGD
jgi:hypothetical protein